MSISLSAKIATPYRLKGKIACVGGLRMVIERA